jgi:hypothetical protein
MLLSMAISYPILNLIGMTLLVNAYPNVYDQTIDQYLFYCPNVPRERAIALMWLNSSLLFLPLMIFAILASSNRD